MGEQELASIHHMLIDSCRSKGIEPGPLSRDDECMRPAIPS
jgi:hypothetical protein